MIDSILSPEPSLPRTLAGFRGSHAGETIVVCGCGSSLRELRAPERFVTIGVNDVGRLFDPTYLVVLNPRSQFRGDRFRYVEESRARALFTQLDLGVRHPHVVRFQLGSRGGTDVSRPGVLPYTRNSPYVALALALHLGAARVGLLGVDFTDGHFFAPTGRHPLARQLSQIDGEYGALARAARERGVEVVNLSAASRLTSLPKMDLESFARGAAPEPRPARHRTAPAPRAPRTFFVHYRFLSCGDVFSTGLANAARSLEIPAGHADWDDPLLEKKVRAFAPDLLFVVHGRRFAERWRDRFRDLRKAVWLLDEPYEVDDTARWSREFDTVFVNDPATLHRHRNARYLPVAFDPELHAAGGEERAEAVGFIGGGNPSREQALVALAREGLLSYVVGGPWRSPVLRKLCRAGNVSPEETAALYRRTRLVLNVFRDRHHYNRAGIAARSLNPRVYEALACGALVVSERRPEIAETFPELPVFDRLDELPGVVHGLLADEERRREILGRCRARLAGHSYANRLRTALEAALGGAPAGQGGERPMIKNPEVTRSADSLPSDWQAIGEAAVLGTADEIVLDKPADDRPGSEGGLASDAPLRNLELAFEVRLSDDATFVAKLHQEDREDQSTNSYHLLCSPGRDYLARHHRILKEVNMPRGRWLQVVLRWREGRLELGVDGRRLAAVADGELESGYCFLGTKGGEVRLRRIRLSALESAAPTVARPRSAGPLPRLAFSRAPLRNLIYHVWPVRGSIWQWNLEQLKQRIDLFNGRRIIGIVHDERSEPPEAVMSFLDGHGCEFVVHPNDQRGEVLTFPHMLRKLASLDPEEVTFYGHAKGVKYGNAVAAPVRQWAEAQYRTALDDWPAVCQQLQDHAITGPLRIKGRFRAHRNLTDWHYTGTFFWLRHARVFSRPVLEVPEFYGGVEVWPALHFTPEETGCLLLDNLQQLPYRPQFWLQCGNPALKRWEARRKEFPPPADLVNPQPFEGYEQPRTEQKPEELSWWIESLLTGGVRRLLTIGVQHGGTEWHIARVFRQQGKDIEITGVDLAPKPEAAASFADAAQRFRQTLRLVGGNSSTPEARRQLDEHYDAVFIDGDHTYRGARMDWELAQAVHARLVGFHDIVDSHWHASQRCCVSRLWSDIKIAHRTEERSSTDWGGIGIVRR